MTSRALTSGVVSLAALDVRRRPDHRSELTSQLLMGETVRLLPGAARRGWREVENDADGYRGWAREWGLVAATPSRASRWRRRARARVVTLFAEVLERPGRGALLSPAFWNARLIPHSRRGRHLEVELPDGRRGWLPASTVETGGARPDLASRIRGLLGIPYLWGGRTPLGFDCSGLTQQVLAEQGVQVARDAVEQYRNARALRRDEVPGSGDLIFFGAPADPVGHVGIGLGGGYFAHCRGRVRINSMDRHNPVYAKELEHQMRGWRRPLK